MEGILFYWAAWSIWIWLTFLVDKHFPYRMMLSAAVLMWVIISPLKVTFGRIELYLSGPLIIIIVCFFLKGEPVKSAVYFYICSLIVSIAYSTFRIFEIFDPVWIIFQREWLLAVILCYLVLLMQNKIKWRFFTLLAGVVQGEFLNFLLFKKYFMYEPITSFAFLDVCAAACLLLFSWIAIEQASIKLSSLFRIYEKENQKTS